MVRLVQIKTIPANNLNQITKKIDNLIQSLENKSSIKFDHKNPKIYVKKIHKQTFFTDYYTEFTDSYFTAGLIISLKNTIECYDTLSQDKQKKFSANPLKFLFEECFNKIKNNSKKNIAKNYAVNVGLFLSGFGTFISPLLYIDTAAYKKKEYDCIKYSRFDIAYDKFNLVDTKKITDIAQEFLKFKLTSINTNFNLSDENIFLNSSKKEENNIPKIISLEISENIAIKMNIIQQSSKAIKNILPATLPLKENTSKKIDDKPSNSINLNSNFNKDCDLITFD
jgi:hypothetical protein